MNSNFEVKHISIADHHSIFIGKCGRLLVTGQNEHNQIGLGQDVKLTKSPKMSAVQKHLKGVSFKFWANIKIYLFVT